MELKYKQTQLDDYITACPIAATNTPIKFADDSEYKGAWLRRLVVIPTPPMLPLPKQDPQIADSFIGEEEQIIRWSAEMLRLSAQQNSLPHVAMSQQMTEEAAESQLYDTLLLFERAEGDWMPNDYLRAVIQSELALQGG